MRCVLAGLILAVFTPAIAAELADDLMARGRAEYQAGRYRAAARFFEQSIASSPERSNTRAAALNNAAQAYLEIGEYARAESLIRRAVEIAPDNGTLLYRMAQAQLRSKHYAQAEQTLSRVISLWQARPDPEAALALSDLAIVYYKQHKVESARAALEKAAAAAEPGQARARIFYNLSEFVWKIGDTQQATARMAQALAEMEAAVGANHPDVAMILDDYSIMLSKTGHRAAARDLEKRAENIRLTFAASANTGKMTVDWRDLK